MRLLLVLLLITCPAFAEAATLYLKKTQAEAESVPAVAELKARTQKAEADANALKQQRQDMVEQNTALTGQYTQLSRSTTNPADIQKNMQQYQEKLKQLNTTLADNNSKIPPMDKETAKLRQQLRLVTWEERISDKDYGVYLASGMDWLDDPKTKKLEKRMLLRDRQGKKYIFDTPQDLKRASIPGCGVWLKDGEIIAVWSPVPAPTEDAKPAEDKSTPVVKPTSLGQVYFLERGNLPKECPFGKISDQPPEKN